MINNPKSSDIENKSIKEMMEGLEDMQKTISSKKCI